MNYENGSLSGEDTITMFQQMIDSGLAWKLQGHYGRTANALVEAGHCADARAVLVASQDAFDNK
jgi:hypothetical protein